MKFIILCCLLTTISLSAQNSLIDSGRYKYGSFITRSDATVLKGKEAFRKKHYQEAIDFSLSALADLPQGPIAQSRRQVCKKLIVQASLKLSQSRAKKTTLHQKRAFLLNLLIYDPENAYIIKTLSNREPQLYLFQAIGFSAQYNEEKSNHALNQYSKQLMPFIY